MQTTVSYPKVGLCRFPNSNENSSLTFSNLNTDKRNSEDQTLTSRPCLT